MYQNFIRVVDMVNVIVSSYDNPEMGDLMLYPSKGNVAFGSGKDCYAFTLTRFARIYADKFKTDKEKMMQRLWGDNYFDAEAKTWKSTETSASGKPLKRAFCNFIMEPIIKIARAIMEGNKEQTEKMLGVIGVEIKSDEKDLTGKHLLKVVMSRWLNAADIIIEMMVLHLPSPKAAQRYRSEYLYEGPKDDPCCLAMKGCDPKGPLMMYVSKMVPTADKSRFFAFGRVFSGTIATG